MLVRNINLEHTALEAIVGAEVEGRERNAGWWTLTLCQTHTYVFKLNIQKSTKSALGAYIRNMNTRDTDRYILLNQY